MQKFLAAVFAAISFAAGATPVTIEWGLSDVSPFNPTPPPERIGGAGIMVVDNQTDGFDKILSLSGEVNGHPITGLTSSPFADANVFDEDGVGSFVTSRGIRFEVEDLGSFKVYNGGFPGNPIYFTFGAEGNPAGVNVGSGIPVYFTRVEEAAPSQGVPEPGTLCLVALAVAGVIGLRRRA